MKTKFKTLNPISILTILGLFILLGCKSAGNSKEKMVKSKVPKSLLDVRHLKRPIQRS